MNRLSGRTLRAVVFLLICSMLTGPVQVHSAPPPWDITADPDTIYIRPPQCSASFKIYVTDYYKTYPVTIFIERDPRNPYAPSGFLFDGVPMLPSRVPDWESTVTALFASPWESPPNMPGVVYTLKIYAYPEGEQSWDVYAIVNYVIVDTGVKACSQDHVTTTFTTFTTPWYTTFTTYRTTTWDWWDWYRWRWDWYWWRGWWIWITGEKFDFSLEATPTTQSVKAGQVTSYTVKVGLVSGAPQKVTLSLSGLPGGASHYFGLSSGDPAFTSALQVSSDASISPGTYTLTVVGTGGGKTHSATVNLVVGKDKDASSLSLSVNPPSVQADETVSISGALSPALGTSVELVYTRPDGFELTKHVNTSGSGGFSDSIQPDMPGAWSVRARWPGDADHFGCESQPATLIVETPPETGPSFWDLVPTIAIVALAALIVIGAVLALRRRSVRRAKMQTVSLARFCKKCGATIPAGAGFCVRCGEKAE